MSKLDDVVDEVLAENYGDLPEKKKKKKRKLEGVDPTQIPAGHEREETMKAVADELAQEAEERAGDEERFRLDPAKFAIENEIASQASSLDVSNAREDRAYCWARFKAEHGISQADYKRSLTIPIREIATGKRWVEKIWHVVEGTDKEAWELRQVDGTRRLGDGILLWAHRHIYEAVQAVVEQKRQEMQGAPQRAAQDFESRTGIKIITEKEMAGDPRFEKITKHAEANRRYNLQEQARVKEQLEKQQRAAG